MKTSLVFRIKHRPGALVDALIGFKEEKINANLSLRWDVQKFLRLYEFTHNPKYLNSAKLAGDWLISMQKRSGPVRPYISYDNAKK